MPLPTPPNLNPYAALGLPPTATPPQIKAAYRRLALLYHPDSVGPNQHWGEINAAYEVLSDPLRRARYDGGHGTKVQVASHRDRATEVAGEVSVRLQVGEPPAPPRGSDITVIVAAPGSQVVAYQRYAPCSRCKASGDANNNGWVIWCKRCAGKGEYVRRRWSWAVRGWISGLCQCERCGGSGVEITRHCAECRGSGRIMAEEVVEVDIPAKGRQLAADATAHSNLWPIGP